MINSLTNSILVLTHIILYSYYEKEENLKKKLFHFDNKLKLIMHFSSIVYLLKNK